MSLANLELLALSLSFSFDDIFLDLGDLNICILKLKSMWYQMIFNCDSSDDLDWNKNDE